MSDTNQKELAAHYCTEIDTYLSHLEGNDPKKRTNLISHINYLTIASAVLPVIMTFISAYAYVVTQQVAILFTSLVNIVPPMLINNTKSKMRHYNSCSDLQLKFATLKGDINRLAAINQLKDQNLYEIDNRLKNFNSILNGLIQIN